LYICCVHILLAAAAASIHCLSIKNKGFLLAPSLQRRQTPMLRAISLSSRLAAARIALPCAYRSVAHRAALTPALLPLLHPQSLTRLRAATPALVRHLSSSSSSAAPQPQPLSSSDGSESFAFQAETKQLLDIVARSLYSDKEVFIREIVSNASDALEKLRLADLQQGAEASGSALNISVTCDDAAGTLTVTDSGIGMSKEELVQCLGTIASSGTRSLVEKLKQEEGGAAATSLIGKFGVGFYSVFMTCDSVKVTTRRRDASVGYLWSSDGSGTYSIQEAADAAPGTSVCMLLRPDCKTFAQTDEVQRVLLKYSNFINFPVLLNGSRINTIDAIWTKDKASISDDDHVKFFRFIADTDDLPAARLHFTVDAPIDIRALLYCPRTHTDDVVVAAAAAAADASLQLRARDHGRHVCQRGREQGCTVLQPLPPTSTPLLCIK